MSAPFSKTLSNAPNGSSWWVNYHVGRRRPHELRLIPSTPTLLVSQSVDNDCRARRRHGMDDRTHHRGGHDGGSRHGGRYCNRMIAAPAIVVSPTVIVVIDVNVDVSVDVDIGVPVNVGAVIDIGVRASPIALSGKRRS